MCFRFFVWILFLPSIIAVKFVSWTVENGAVNAMTLVPAFSVAFEEMQKIGRYSNFTYLHLTDRSEFNCVESSTTIDFLEQSFGNGLLRTTNEPIVLFAPGEFLVNELIDRG